ncbi:class I SAM-dependent methyltransferase [Gynuella sunshinyii]|uniref:class I SAM-dependent methyltransferase n=1 Tax=Gynuella sunshinyii TaxID=1445505 RepID=UPI00069B5CFD|nr:class I SAM-dependent methyltransferase [Gynuella sunshinyii]
MANNSDKYGYVVDAVYADRFYKEQSPVWLNYVAMLHGSAPRDLNQPFHYLELGCGFGNSVLVNAGAYPHGHFIACDINPDHIIEARSRAERFAIHNVEFQQASFEELLAQEQLPQFDFIVLHGVYSWVATEVRTTIRQILATHLKPGGLVYISYNCKPGWSPEEPLRKLLVELSRTEAGDSAQRARGALQTLNQLSSKLNYFKQHPSVITGLNAYIHESDNYLAHEFLNHSWQTFYSVDIAEEMNNIGLAFVGSATLVDNHPFLLVDEATHEAINQLPTDRQRQLAFDFACNRRFRRDIFINGTVEPQKSLLELVSHIPFAAIKDPEFITDIVTTPRGKISFGKSFMVELRTLMKQGAISFHQTLAHMGGKSRNEMEILRNLVFLIAAGELQVCQNVHVAGTGNRVASPTIRKMLEFIIETGAALPLPSPVLGNGFPLDVVEAVALVSWLDGAENREQLVSPVQQYLRQRHRATALRGEELDSQGRRIGKQVWNVLVPQMVGLGIFT